MTTFHPGYISERSHIGKHTQPTNHLTHLHACQSHADNSASNVELVFLSTRHLEAAQIQRLKSRISKDQHFKSSIPKAGWQECPRPTTAPSLVYSLVTDSRCFLRHGCLVSISKSRCRAEAVAAVLAVRPGHRAARDSASVRRDQANGERTGQRPGEGVA